MKDPQIFNNLFFMVFRNQRLPRFASKLGVDAWNATDSLKYADVNVWDCDENK